MISPIIFAPLLTSHGNLILASDVEAQPLSDEIRQRVSESFALGAGHGLLHLGAAEIGRILPPVWAWWRDFSVRYVTAICVTNESSGTPASPPDSELLATLITNAPPMTGAEYLTPAVLVKLWHELDAALLMELAEAKVSLQDFLKARNPVWNLVGRVHFNLAENRRDAEAPFAFLATYTSRLSAYGKVQHLSLSQALTEFSGGKNKAQLLSLLLPVQRATEHCEWLRDMVNDGDLYHPLRWTPVDAFRFLTDASKLETAGIVVRTPGTWKAGRPARPVVKASVGARPPSLLGADALLDFSMSISLEGEQLSREEMNELLKGGDGLHLLRGRWVEVDKKTLSRLMLRFQTIEQAAENGLPFAEAMRLLAGASLGNAGDPADADWSQLVAGPWLAEILQGLRQPEGLAQIAPGAELKATLRPYQQAGVRWLYLLTRLGLGACLADDMGMGKTIQVLSLLLVLKRESAEALPSLLIAPASLLFNWQAEAERFAPSLRVLVVHPSAMSEADFRALDSVRLAAVDLVITSYGTLLRQPVLESIQWRLAVIDEAQAIKNPGAKQTKQVKKIIAQSRIALTGTPVENRLSDLWSIFDFTHPGLLGTEKVFASFTKRLAQNAHFGPLRSLVRPYILRRLKTDKQVIADLPDKTEPPRPASHVRYDDMRHGQGDGEPTTGL
jgi:hypothetical protein